MVIKSETPLSQVVDKKGTPWMCRLLKLTDAALLSDFFDSLSTNSKTTFQPHPLTTPFAQYLAGRVDSTSHIRAVITTQTSPTRIVGYAFITRLPLTSLGYFGIAISDEYQGRGLSTVLMKYIFEKAREMHLTKIYLNVLADNQVAIQSYAKRGFLIIEPPWVLSKFFTLFELWYNGTLSDLWQPRTQSAETHSTAVWMLKQL